MASIDAKEAKDVVLRPLFIDNPVALQVLGICSALAVTSKMETAFVMCIALTTVVFETGLRPATPGENALEIDTPAGRVTAFAQVADWFSAVPNNP